MPDASPSDSHLEPIAIIGLACRFPGAPDAAAFWELLRNGVDAITQVPADRWDADALYDPDPAAPGKMNSKWGGFVEGIDRFDAEFFGISPREADLMDPQQRMLLEAAWHALEDAAIAPASLAGTLTGVFIGNAAREYATLLYEDLSLVQALTNSGGSGGIISNRISYTLDLHGPSLTVDTACSSSLVAIHLACQSLWTGESTLALAGGANAIFTPGSNISTAKSRLLSPDGRCRAFDANADGFARGEGAGVVVLKPLNRAMADGDPIHAVIRGTATRQAGRTNGMMAPNRWIQEEVVRHACNRAGVSPGTISYVEAQSGGSPIGDAAELNALGAVLAVDRALGDKCAIGSVKTNIGHLEAVAGMAALIKTVLMLRHRQLVPTLHYRSPNTQVPFQTLPLRVQQVRQEWTGELLRAAICGSGFGGAYACAVLDSAPQPSDCASQTTGEDVLLLSARSPQALRELAEQYAAFLETTDASLAQVCLTSATGRNHFQHRIAAVALSLPELRESLRTFLRDGAAPGVVAGVVPRRAPVASLLSPSAPRAEVAQRYVQGMPLPFDPIFPKGSVRRLHGIPKYPFQRKRHWYTAAPRTTRPSLSPTIAAQPPLEEQGSTSTLSVEQRVLNIFRRVLGNQALAATDDFFESGGSSLMAVELLTELERTFDASIPPLTLMQRPTAQRLAPAIGSGATRTGSSLAITLRSTGKRPPFFVVTPGHLFRFTALSRRLTPGHPIHVMAIPERFSQPGVTIDEIASACLSELDQIYPDGPFHLFGFCVGGCVVYEMAQRLTEFGRQPLSVGLLDSPSPAPNTGSGDGRPDGQLAYLRWRLQIHARKLRQLPLRTLGAYVIGRSMSLVRHVRTKPAPLTPDQITFFAHRDAILRYVPKPYSGELDLYAASELWEGVTVDTRDLWRRLAPQGRTAHITGSHLGVFQEPYVAGLADTLNARLATDIEKVMPIDQAMAAMA